MVGFIIMVNPLIAAIIHRIVGAERVQLATSCITFFYLLTILATVIVGIFL